MVVISFINNYCIVKYFTSERHNSHSPWLVVYTMDSLRVFLQHKQMYSCLVKLDWVLLIEEVKTPDKPRWQHIHSNITRAWTMVFGSTFLSGLIWQSDGWWLYFTSLSFQSPWATKRCQLSKFKIASYLEKSLRFKDLGQDWKQI